MTPETALKKKIKDLLNIAGIFNYPLTAGIGSHPGLADRVAHYRGHVVYIEAKVGNRPLGSKQIEFRDQCKRDEIFYLVIRSEEELIKAFNLPFQLQL
jgi:hypothetical protein